MLDPRAKRNCSGIQEGFRIQWDLALLVILIGLMTSTELLKAEYSNLQTELLLTTCKVAAVGLTAWAYVKRGVF